MSKPNLMTYAKEIRKEGESWKDAVSRAQVELFGTSEDSAKPKNRQKSNEKKPSGEIRGANETGADFFKRKRSM
jgi:hypothetical protein